jgi:hypothetical protein
LAAVTSIVGMDVSPFAVVGGNNVLKDIVVAVELFGKAVGLSEVWFRLINYRLLRCICNPLFTPPYVAD